MPEVDAFEAKKKLSALLDAVERGEEVTITRGGKPVARLVRPAATFNRAKARAAAARIRKRLKGVTLGGLAIKDLINEGRSLEQELREVLTVAAPLTAKEKVALFRKIRAKSPPLKDFDIGAAIRAGRDDESLA
jgi:prevent-host-death family protein